MSVAVFNAARRRNFVVLLSACYLLFGFFAGCDQSAPVVNQSQAQPKLLIDLWYSSYLEKNHIGYSHLTRQKISENGRELWKTVLDNQLRMKRGRDSIELKIVSTIYEDMQEKLVRIDTRSNMSNNVSVTKAAVVSNNLIIMDMKTAKVLKKIDWLPEFVVNHSKGFESKLKRQSMVPGNSWTWQVYHPDQKMMIQEKWTVEDAEQGEKGEKRIKMKSLLSSPTKELYIKHFWFDQAMRITKVSALGAEDVLTDKSRATNIPTDGQFDVIGGFKVSLTKPLEKGHDTQEAIYQIKLSGGIHGETNLKDYMATGFTQSVKQISPKLFEVKVRAVTPQSKSDQTFTDHSKPTDEDRKPSQLIQSDDPKVKKLANSIITNKKDRWATVQAIRQFVFRYIQNSNYKTAWASAAEVVDSKSGDCTERSVLMIALSRAKGIPARGVMGLVYMPQQQAFLYHMWAEVWVNEKWVPVEPSFDRWQLSAAYLKISHSSLDSGLADPAILSLSQFLAAKPVIKVIKEK